MKKLLLVLVVILTALGMSACQEMEQTDSIIELETYDYYLLFVVSRERQSQDTFVYVLREVGSSETPDNITYESDKLWSVGEFVIAIELDEKGNIYLTDLDATTSMFETIKEVVKIQPLTFVRTIDETDFNDVLRDFEMMMNIYKDYLNNPEIHDTISYDNYVKITNEQLYYRVLNKWGYENK